MGTRSKKPTALKVLHGNPGKRPLPKDEPVFKSPTGTPTAPRTLGYYGKKMWKRVWPLLSAVGVATERDCEIIEAGCMAYQQLVKATQQLNKEGYVIDRWAYDKKEECHVVVGKMKHPACGVRHEAHNQLMKCLSELGMTPAASTKVKAVEVDDKDPLAQFLNGPQTAQG